MPQDSEYSRFFQTIQLEKIRNNRNEEPKAVCDMNFLQSIEISTLILESFTDGKTVPFTDDITCPLSPLSPPLF